MLTIDFARVAYNTKNGWTFSAVMDGRLVERNISEYHALILAESIMAAAKKAKDPDPIERAA
jgi:hypothetical protein